MKYITITIMAFFLCACTPTFWPFESKIVEDVIEDVDQELKCEAPQCKPPFIPPITTPVPIEKERK